MIAYYMYWFACVNDNSPFHRDMYIVALKSSIKNTKLKPIIIYDGNNEQFQKEVADLGGKVINHVLSFSNKPGFTNRTQQWQNTARGAYLRTDIPLICKQHNITDNYVLYTDTDVIFLKDVEPELSALTPRYFAVCPEFKKTEWSYFNSGVMLINLKNMTEIYNEFLEYMEQKGYLFKMSKNYDQAALNEFFEKTYERLPLKFNHKPYWGIDNTASIIHYHGPKYVHIVKLLTNQMSHQSYNTIFTWVDKSVWIYYQNLYEEYMKV
jgi:lipopolysaccharide biosynthesis glycosyltransferase